MNAHNAARESARSLSVIGDVLTERARALARFDPDGWTGTASEAMGNRAGRLATELSAIPEVVGHAERALEVFAEQAELAWRQRRRGAELDREASRITARWKGEHGSDSIDPGAVLRLQARRLITDADEIERGAALVASNSIREAAAVIRRGHLLTRSVGSLAPSRILDGIGDLVDEIIDTAGDGLEWGWNRATDVAEWAARQAEKVVDGVIWVGGRAIDVGQGLFDAVLDEARVAYARARFAPDFALFHLTGNAPDRLPDLSDEYRRTQNVWSYSLIPAIEAGGGECTRLDNGIFACLSDGIELPGDLGTVPLKGRGGTTYGEVFIVDDAERYQRVQEPGSPLADHEKNHSIQWAIHGPAAFALLYLQDVALSGNNGRHQYFEQQAGAEAGGYRD